ncbi:MAG: amidophosphoribosyltransferase [Candidatus Margulisbacteria bacterium]|nr:amidophosphoribosyltransferase [Candidatus Margulisiibacteriota bacterium]
MCGIFGIYSNKLSVVESTYFGLFALQHRGQESAGISISNGEQVHTIKKVGLISQVFTKEDLAKLPVGDMAIGHVRYSTSGSCVAEKAYPFAFMFKGTYMSLANNGSLLNIKELSDWCINKGVRFNGISDTEIIATMLSLSEKDTIEEAIAEVAKQLKGAYSFVVLAPDKIVGVRDPFGINPMAFGEVLGGYAIASEDCALGVVGAQYIREVMPGEMVIITRTSVKSSFVFEPQSRLAVCAFEFLYLARPDSSISGKNLYEARVRMGRNLYREHPADADAVISVPDSGTPAAIGFSKESGISFAEGLIKNRYIGRTFIQPDQLLREVGVRLKLNPIVSAIKNKRIVLVDDSIVRGTTSKKIVKLLRSVGAKEIHIRISSPEVKWPCFYGIDTESQDELIAANYSVDEIGRMLEVDSIGYLSLKGLVNAIHLPANHLCLACFNGDYPVGVPEHIKKSKMGTGKSS